VGSVGSRNSQPLLIGIGWVDSGSVGWWEVKCNLDLWIWMCPKTEQKR